jgi:hypothetical protein
MRGATIFFILSALLSTAQAQTEIRSIENCVLSMEGKTKMDFETEVFNCLAGPEGFYLLSSDEDVVAFYSKYPLNSANCNTYQLPKINFDTCSILFFKIPYWTGTQLSKQFYFAEDTLVLYLELVYKTKDMDSPLNLELGFYSIGKAQGVYMP